MKYYPEGSVGVEDIQDWIEEYLMRSDRLDVAKAYINYRYLHSLAREKYNKLMTAV